MATDGPSVYRGATREAAELAYHADARANLRAGYVPASEVWSTALGQQVLTVVYVYAPDQAPAVLDALAHAEIEAARPASPVPAPSGQPGFAAVRLPEPPMPAPAVPAKRSPLGLVVTVIVALIALGGVLASQGMLSLPTAPGLPQGPDAANRPPAGQVWFGRNFDPSTFAVHSASTVLAPTMRS